MSRFCAICVSTEKYYKCTVTENTGIDSGNGSGKQQKRTHKPRDAYWNNSGVTNNHGEREITPKNDSFRVSHKHPMAKSARFPRVFRVFRALFRNRGKRGKRAENAENARKTRGFCHSAFPRFFPRVSAFSAITPNSATRGKSPSLLQLCRGNGLA